MVRNYWLDKKKQDKIIKVAKAIFDEVVARRNKKITICGKKGGK
jgi:hypothetical protein